MRLLWLESRLVRLRGQVYIFWHVLPVLEVKERWRDKPWWCEHFSGVSGKLSCRSMLQPFFPPLKHISILLSRPRDSFSKTPVEFSGLWRGVTMSSFCGLRRTEHFLAAPLQFARILCPDGVRDRQGEHPHPSWLHPQSSSMGFIPSHIFPGLLG